MVDSGVYACQFVLVVKLAAVLNASAGSTGPRCCGLNGSRCCRRSMPYVPSNPNRLKASSEKAYTGQVCSRAGSTPERRYRIRSARPSTAGSGCRVPSNTRNMYAPRGRVRASTTREKSAICIHPMAVMSEPFRPEQRVAEVDGQEHGEREPDPVFEAHGAPPSRAQKRTYAHEPAKNAALASTSSRSIMPRCSASAMPETAPSLVRFWRRLLRARRAKCKPRRRGWLQVAGSEDGDGAGNRTSQGRCQVKWCGKHPSFAGRKCPRLPAGGPLLSLHANEGAHR